MGFWDRINENWRAAPNGHAAATAGDSGPTGTSAEPHLVRAQVVRITASEHFAQSERLGDFLRHVGDETLAGRSDRLTGRSIGREVFGRGADFDPQHDSIVRVCSVIAF